MKTMIKLMEALTSLKEEYTISESVLTEHGMPDEVQQKYVKKFGIPNVRELVSESSAGLQDDH